MNKILAIVLLIYANTAFADNIPFSNYLEVKNEYFENGMLKSVKRVYDLLHITDAEFYDIDNSLRERVITYKGNIASRVFLKGKYYCHYGKISNEEDILPFSTAFLEKNYEAFHYRIKKLQEHTEKRYKANFMDRYICSKDNSYKEILFRLVFRNGVFVTGREVIGDESISIDNPARAEKLKLEYFVNTPSYWGNLKSWLLNE